MEEPLLRVRERMEEERVVLDKHIGRDVLPEGILVM